MSKEGEVDFNCITNEGHIDEMVFQIAEVNTALGSISYLVDNGCNMACEKGVASGVVMSMVIFKKTTWLPGSCGKGSYGS